jgi:hypothetical protein
MRRRPTIRAAASAAATVASIRLLAATRMGICATPAVSAAGSRLRAAVATQLGTVIASAPLLFNGGAGRVPPSQEPIGYEQQQQPVAPTAPPQHAYYLSRTPAREEASGAASPPLRLLLPCTGGGDDFFGGGARAPLPTRRETPRSPTCSPRPCRATKSRPRSSGYTPSDLWEGRRCL